MTAAQTNLPSLIAEVSAKLARIEKRGTAPSAMGGFSFVRETDVMDALKPELDGRGIVLRPDVELLRLDTFARSGKDMPNTVATISLALYAVRGAEEYLISRTVGQGADTQDKAVGKAVTAAKKQAILIAFAIPTGDDPDASAIPERSSRNKQPEPGERTGREASRSAAATTPVPAQYRRGELAQVLADRHLDLAAAQRYADAIGIPADERPMSNESIDRLIAAIIRDSARGESPGLLDEVLAATGGTLIDSDVSPASEPEAGVLAPAPAEPPKPGTDEYKALPTQEKAAARAHWAKVAA